MITALALAVLINEDPQDLGKRMFDALDQKQPNLLFEMMVREERQGFGISGANYTKLVNEYVVPALAKANGPVEFESFDGRVNKLYGTWHYPYEFDAKRSYTLSAGRTVTVTLGIISTPQGYRVSGLVNNLVETVMVGKQLPSAKPSSLDLSRARFEGAKADSGELSRFGIRGMWKSPRTGLIVWERYLAEQKRTLTRAGAAVN
jgi:hypothetical protein